MDVPLPGRRPVRPGHRRPATGQARPARACPTNWPPALHVVERHASNPIEADHGRLKARLRPIRGLKRHRSARILAAGHAFVQNLRRGHYDIATGTPIRHRLCTAFDDLARTI